MTKKTQENTGKHNVNSIIESFEAKNIRFRLGQNGVLTPIFAGHLAYKDLQDIKANKHLIIAALSGIENPDDYARQAAIEGMMTIADKRAALGVIVDRQALQAAIDGMTTAEIQQATTEANTDTLERFSRWQLIVAGRVTFEAGQRQTVETERDKICANRADAHKRRIEIRQNPALPPLTLSDIEAQKWA